MVVIIGNGPGGENRRFRSSLVNEKFEKIDKRGIVGESLGADEVTYRQ